MLCELLTVFRLLSVFLREEGLLILFLFLENLEVCGHVADGTFRVKL